MGKGIIEQIEESNVTKISDKFTLSMLKEMLETLEIDHRKEFKKRGKRAKQNIKELVKRSKELNKEIPIELLYILGSTDIYYVGTEFMNKYKEWLTD